MKLRLLALALVLVVSLTGLITATAALHARTETVVLWEDPLYGDKAAAEGLAVSLLPSLERRFQWEITARPGGETRTAFRPHLLEQATPSSPPVLFDCYLSNALFNSTSRHYQGGLSLTEGSRGSSAQGSPGEWDDPLLRDVMERTRPGTTRRETLRAGDYLTELPLEMGFRSTDPAMSPHTATTATLTEGLRQRFSFPVPEDAAVAITVSRGEGGLFYRIEREPGSPDAIGQVQESSYSPTTGGVITDTAEAIQRLAAGELISLSAPLTQRESPWFYFALEGRLSDGSLMDFSGTPGGYALYRMDLSDLSTAPSTVEAVYPLDREEHIEMLTLSPDGTELFLQMGTEEGSVLHIFDAATGQHRQVLPASPRTTLYFSGDCLLLDIWENYVCAELQLYEKRGDAYEKVLTGPGPGVLEDTHPYVDPTDFAWDGEKLAVLYRAPYRSPEGDGSLWVPSGYDCGFLLDVYGGDGLLYTGQYHSSLNGVPIPYPPKEMRLVWEA